MPSPLPSLGVVNQTNAGNLNELRSWMIAYAMHAINGNIPNLINKKLNEVV